VAGSSLYFDRHRRVAGKDLTGKPSLVACRDHLNRGWAQPWRFVGCGR
jgi:hypothetical protein